MYNLKLDEIKTRVYYTEKLINDNKINNVMISMGVINGTYEKQYHSSDKHFIPQDIELEMQNILYEYYHGLALVVNKFIKELPINSLYKVTTGFIIVLYPNGINEKYIDYDRYYYRTGIVGSGYYWKARLQKDDMRIGRRKLYINSKGYYIIENGYREFVKDFSINKRSV